MEWKHKIEIKFNYQKNERYILVHLSLWAGIYKLLLIQTT